MTAINDLIEVARKHLLYQNVVKTSGKIVIGRGEKINPEYLFIGEAPGQDENKAGKPFVGRSGKMLDNWLSKNNIKSFTIINAVPIIPLDSVGKIRAPTEEEIKYFRPYTKALIKEINPKKIVCLGKSAARFIEKEKEFKNTSWSGNIGFIYHPSFYMRNGKNGLDDFAKLVKDSPIKEDKTVTQLYKSEVEFQNISAEDAVKKFLGMIGGNFIDKNKFTLNGETWFVDYHPYQHSDDIIVHEDDIGKYDKFLLVKTGSDRIRIPGFTDKKKLMSTPKRDIYRNGKYYYIVHDTNVNNLSSFNILDTDKVLKSVFIINQQKAENLGHTEMISGILAGLHSFAKQAGMFFKDINQKDECILGEKKVKIYTRDAMSDEDMLIYENYYQAHPEIDLYICCKIKAGNYNYIGYVEKSVVDTRPIVSMIGQDSSAASGDLRRIFAEMYKNLSDFIKIYETEKKEEEIIIPQSYVPLHCHCEYSVGDSFGTTKYLAEILYKKGFKACALTDHGTLAGLWEFQKNMLEKNLKPILGCEIYVRRDGDDQRYHLGVLIKNEQGWKNILKLHSMAVRDHFYYKPIVMLEELFKYKEGLIILSGCSSSLIHNLIRKGNSDEADVLMKRFKDEFGDDFYAEMQIHDIKETKNQEVLKIIYGMAQKYNIKSVMTTDSHYPKKEDKEFHEAMKAIDMKKEYGTAGYGDDCFYLMEDDDFLERINKDDWKSGLYKDFLRNTNEVADKCNFLIKNSGEKDTLPKIDFGNISRAEMLKKMAIEGLKKNTPYKYEGKIKERLDLELDRFISKGYENYFLIVADMIAWAKSNGISVGPCRGSAGASLAAFALNITEVDPIEHDLLFDRFISEIRRDAPDIDVDYMDTRKDEMYDYLCNKYGKDHCAKVATYARFHPKGIMRDVGRIFKIPIPDIEKICSMVIERSGGDARASFSLTDTFSEFAEAKAFAEKYPQPTKIAMKLEGHIRHRGIHAAAIITTERDISSYIPITKIGGEFATEWEKQLCEDIGLIKFDVLGLQTLTIIKDCIDSAKTKLPRKFDDINVFKNVFWTGNTVGVFQFNTVGMTKFSQSLNLESFNDLYDATTLFRPGALHSGQSQMYANRKNGKEAIEYMHPTLEPITKATRGIILYQEQIMQIMNQVGGMSWATAEMARKAITKSKGKDAFNKMRDEFVRNAFKIHNMPTEEGERLYDVVSTFGSYSFNKSHAVGYSIISYWCAWLKTYYPKEFYKAILKYENDNNILQDIIQEAKTVGIEIEYPDINKSDFSYELIDKNIYAGLNTIVGIGSKVAQKIIKNRPYKDVDDFRKKCKISDKIFKGLLVADAFRSFNIVKQAYYLDRLDLEQDWDDIEWARMIYEQTTLKPKIDIFQTFDFGDYKFINIRELDDKVGGTHQFIRGIVTSIINKDKLIRPDANKHVHQFQRHMIYLNLNDGTGNIACQVNPATYEKYQTDIQFIEKQPVVVYGNLSKDGRKMYADMLQIVDGVHKTNSIDSVFKNLDGLQKGQVFITGAQPAVSKAGKSYYRLNFSNGAEGLLFRLTRKLYPGLKVMYRITQPPFIDSLQIIGDGRT